MISLSHIVTHQQKWINLHHSSKEKNHVARLRVTGGLQNAVAIAPCKEEVADELELGESPIEKNFSDSHH